MWVTRKPVEISSDTGLEKQVRERVLDRPSGDN